MYHVPQSKDQSRHSIRPSPSSQTPLRFRLALPIPKIQSLSLSICPSTHGRYDTYHTIVTISTRLISDGWAICGASPHIPSHLGGVPYLSHQIRNIISSQNVGLLQPANPITRNETRNNLFSRTLPVTSARVGSHDPPYKTRSPWPLFSLIHLWNPSLYHYRYHPSTHTITTTIPSILPPL
jgi:hypothetical protein